MEKISKYKKNPFAFPGYRKELADKLDCSLRTIDLKLKANDYEVLDALANMAIEREKLRIENDKKIYLINDKLTVLNNLRSQNVCTTITNIKEVCDDEA